MKNRLLSAPYIIWVILVGLLVFSLLISMRIGSYNIPVTTIIDTMLHRFLNISSGASILPAIETTLYEIRLPRIVLAVLTGMSLSASGVSLQAVFRNPLVDPFILGISAGAAMGGALSLAFMPEIPVQAASFVCGLAAVLLALFLAHTGQDAGGLPLILAGIVVSSLFSACLSTIQFLVDPDRLGSIIFWLMGSFSRANWKTVYSVAPFMLSGLLLLIMIGWRLNILSLGEEDALSLGVQVNRFRFFIIITASLLTALSVSVCGIIGWVGLVVPHIARLIVGPEHKRLVPFTILLGGIFMLWVDNISRSFTDYEIPVGIVTSLCGAPFFMFLLKRSREIWEA